MTTLADSMNLERCKEGWVSSTVDHGKHNHNAPEAVADWSCEKRALPNCEKMWISKTPEN